MMISLRLEGSALYKLNPRDWDLRLYFPDEIFGQLYLPADQFIGEGRTGDWSEARWHWANDCVRIAHLLANLSGKNVDFMIWPELLKARSQR